MLRRERIKGLAKDDFEVFEDGARQDDLAFFARRRYWPEPGRVPKDDSTNARLGVFAVLWEQSAIGFGTHEPDRTDRRRPDGVSGPQEEDDVPSVRTDGAAGARHGAL